MNTLGVFLKFVERHTQRAAPLLQPVHDPMAFRAHTLGGQNAVAAGIERTRTRDYKTTSGRV